MKNELNKLAIWSGAFFGFVGLLGVSLSGCASTSTLTPQAQADIADAYAVMCGPDAPTTISGLVGIAEASAAAIPSAGQSELATAMQICAAGVPDNEVVAGVDLFNLLVEVESLVPAKKVSAHARALAARHRT